MQTLQRKKTKLDLSDLVNLFRDKEENKDVSNNALSNSEGEIKSNEKRLQTNNLQNVFDGQNEIGNRFIDFLIRHIEKVGLRVFQINAPTVEAYESEIAIITAIIKNEDKEKLNNLSKHFIKAHTHSIKFHNRSNWIENKLNIKTHRIKYENNLFAGMICSELQVWIIKAIIRKLNSREI